MGPLTAPAPLGVHHLLDDFDSGEPALDDWLRRRALSTAAAGASRAYAVCNGDAAVAYCALAVGAIDHRAAAGRLQRNMTDPIPIMIIWRLAVDRLRAG